MGTQEAPALRAHELPPMSTHPDIPTMASTAATLEAEVQSKVYSLNARLVVSC